MQGKNSNYILTTADGRFPARLCDLSAVVSTHIQPGNCSGQLFRAVFLFETMNFGRERRFASAEFKLCALSSLYPVVRFKDVPFAKDYMGDQFILRDGIVLRFSEDGGKPSTLEAELFDFLTR